MLEQPELFGISLSIYLYIYILPLGHLVPGLFRKPTNLESKLIVNVSESMPGASSEDCTLLFSTRWLDALLCSGSLFGKRTRSPGETGGARRIRVRITGAWSSATVTGRDFEPRRRGGGAFGGSSTR